MPDDTKSICEKRYVDEMIKRSFEASVTKNGQLSVKYRHRLQTTSYCNFYSNTSNNAILNLPFAVTLWRPFFSKRKHSPAERS